MYIFVFEKIPVPEIQDRNGEAGHGGGLTEEAAGVEVWVLWGPAGHDLLVKQNLTTPPRKTNNKYRYQYRIINMIKCCAAGKFFTGSGSGSNKKGGFQVSTICTKF